MTHYVISISMLINDEYVKQTNVIIKDAITTQEAVTTALFGEVHNQNNITWIDELTVKEDIFLYEIDNILEVSNLDIAVVEKYFNVYTVNELMPVLH